MNLRSARVFWAGFLLVGLVRGAAIGSEGANFFTHGPILGRLSKTGVGVWARTGKPGRFQVRYGLASGALDKLSKPVSTVLAHDNTGWVHLDGLVPNTRYRYQLVLPEVSGDRGRAGTFRTLPDRSDFVSELNPRGLFNFSFEFACGNDQNFTSNGPSLPTFQTMLERISDRIHFAIQNGDWLYEARRDYTVSRWRQQVECDENDVPRLLKIAPSLVAVWENYKYFLTQGIPLTRWHANVPSYFTYDDHEILNDVWGAGTPGLRDRRAVFRDIGVRAWYDYLGWSNPTTFPQRVLFGRAKMEAGSNVLFDPEADFTKVDYEQANNLHVHWGTKTAAINDNALDEIGGDPNAGVYEVRRVIDRNHLEINPAARVDGEVSYSIGRRSYYRLSLANCEIFVLDTRGQREMHDTRDPFKKGLSMLGPKQRRWLLDGMTKSAADFIFVVSSVNFMVPHVGGGKVRATNKDDAWTVFLDEREALIDFWDQLDKPVLVLTGDLHNSFVIKITDNVWEFASGPHNSINHLAKDEGDRPPNGPFKYGPREVDIRWSTYYRSDIPRSNLLHPNYCVVQVNNVIDNPLRAGEERWVPYPRPQVVFQYYDGHTGELKYAEAILARSKETGSQTER